MNPGLIPPEEVAAAAKRGLELRAKFRRGGTSVGAHRAKELAERGVAAMSVAKTIADMRVLGDRQGEGV